MMWLYLELQTGSFLKKHLIFELSKDDFEKYKNVIPQADTTYWLKEAGEKSNEILCVQTDGNIKGEDVSNS